jgi:hypothetical protein
VKYLNEKSFVAIMDKALVVFQDKKVRRIWHDDKWYFSIIDIIAVLTASSLPRRYWSDLNIKLKNEGFELYDKIVQLKLRSSDGKYYETDCANTETLFRLIQSVPSPKVEPFKLWLAQVGYERVQEIKNPELAQSRMKEIYRSKGYSDEWIEKRVRGIAIRDELTDEWKKRNVKEGKEYAILTNEISKAAFGKTVEEYKEFKGLKKENLRDHMDDLELIFNMLGEASTTKIARNKNAQGFPENKDAARRGGKVAGVARKELEDQTGDKVVTPDNYLNRTETRKKLEQKNRKNR